MAVLLELPAMARKVRVMEIRCRSMRSRGFVYQYILSALIPWHFSHYTIKCPANQASSKAFVHISSSNIEVDTDVYSIVCSKYNVMDHEIRRV